MTLDEIRKLIDAATPGPWQDDGESESWTEDQGYASSWVETPKGAWRQYGPDTGSDMCQQRNDARFIAAARTLLPALLEVAQGAKDFSDTWEMKDSSYTPLAKALAALEALKL